MTEDRRRRSPRPKGRSSPTRPRGPADRPRSHPPSKQLTEQVPETEKNSPRWWTQIRLSHTPGRRGALPQTPNIEDDYDYRKYDFPLWWASIRLADLLKIAHANGPKMWTIRLALAEGVWQAFLREQAEVRSRLRRTNWSEVPALELVAFVEGAAAIRIGIGALPREYADLSFAARSVLYLRMLILWGTLRGGPFPLRPALEAVALHEGAPYAITEMFRRGSRHVGFYMFLLLSSGNNEARVAEALEGLRKVTPLNKKPKTRDYIADALERVLGTGRGRAATLGKALDAQAFETGKGRWGHHGLRGLTLRWLAGKLNIAPRAVADDLMDQTRAITRRLNKEVLFNEEDICIDISDEASEAVARDVIKGVHDEAQSDFDRSRERAEEQDLVGKFLIQHPEHRRGFEAIRADELQADFARQHGVTVQTVINWENRTITAFREWSFANGKAAPANINHKRSKGHPREPRSEERKLKQATSLRPDIRARFLSIVEKVKDAQAREAVTPPSPSAS